MSGCCGANDGKKSGTQATASKGSSASLHASHAAHGHDNDSEGGSSNTGHGWTHYLMMALCIALPVGLLVVVYGFGIRNPAVYWIALLMCPVIHLIMMAGGKKGH